MRCTVGIYLSIMQRQIKGLTARVAYQEFTNRGIFIPLVGAILGGAAKIFGFIGNPQNYPLFCPNGLIKLLSIAVIDRDRVRFEIAVREKAAGRGWGLGVFKLLAVSRQPSVR
jgi:hypothetical protein